MNKEENKKNKGGFGKFKKFELPKGSEITPDGVLKNSDANLNSSIISLDQSLLTGRLSNEKIEIARIENNSDNKEKIVIKVEDKIEKNEQVDSKKSKPISNLNSKNSNRKVRAKQLSSFVTDITLERVDLIKDLEGRNKSDIFEQAIEEYQKKHHPDLVLQNKEWKSFFGAYNNNE